MRAWIRKETTNQNDSGPALKSWPRPLRELLLNRGFYTQESIDQFIKPDLQNLKNPFLLKGMDLACARLATALENQEKVCIYADFDLDGTSGCALLKTAFENLGFQNLVPYQPKRLKHGYGFHAPVVEELHLQGVSLIVTCDVGITAIPACSRAQDLGVDVIITDHHLATGELPKALSIINPNQPGDQSGLGYLSGAGVGFYLVRALKRFLVDKGLKAAEKLILKDLLDCFTIATLTDMVPLIEDNRVLTQVGLKVLSQTQRPGLQALMQELGLYGKALSSNDVAIRFAPKLNALSRLEGEVLPLDLYIEKDIQKAYSVVQFVLDQNSQRVQLQSDAILLAEKLIQVQSHWPCHVIYSETFHRGVVGLIATALTEQTQKPCFVASLDIEEQKMVGSARLPDVIESSLVEALESVSSNLLRFGGHAQAAGFEISLSQIQDFQNGLVGFFTQNNNRLRVVHYDSEIESNDLTWELIEKMQTLEPFGVGFESPLFLVRNGTVKSVKTLKGQHLKLELVLKNKSDSVAALLFNPSPRQRELIKIGSKLDLLVQVQVNEWKGRRTLQLLIEDTRVAQREAQFIESHSELL